MPLEPDPDLQEGGWLHAMTAGGMKGSPLVRGLLVVLLIVAVAAMFPHGDSSEFHYSVGSVWTDRALVAPFSFPLYKDSRVYDQERADAIRAVFPIYRQLETAGRPRLDTLRELLQTVAGSKTSGPELTEAEMLLVRRLSGPKPPGPALRRLEDALAAALDEIYRRGLIDTLVASQNQGRIAVRRGVMESIAPSAQLMTRASALAYLSEAIGSRGMQSDTAVLLVKLCARLLKPSLVYDHPATLQAMRLAEENVPRTLGLVRQGELIVSKQDRITEEVRLKLESYHRARIDRSTSAEEFQRRVGSFLHAGVIITMFGVYLFLFRRKMFADNSKLAIIALLIFLEVLAAYASLQVDVGGSLEYLIVVPAASMLLTIVFDSRVAFYGTVVIALLVGAVLGSDYSIALVALLGGSLSAYTVRDISSRTQIFRSIWYIFVGYSIPIIALALERLDPFSAIMLSLTFTFANAILSPVLTFALLIFFERVFRVTTDLTLVELTDLNRPLLKELSEKAPGTFHHSVTLGGMAEAAADAIGANAVLARVGAYYHDIGKVLKPEYFVENQVGGQNKHGRLKPRMSALIIAAHVKEGVELGAKFGLPEKILDFIPQHHGTTRMEYFYDKALRQAAKRPTNETVHEDDFRYHGPKPQSKEAAIVMLADSVEASTRSMPELTAQSLEGAIESMIRQRFLEGQLDECSLTLRDLNRIRDAFVKILSGIHHQRIQYPQQAERDVEHPRRAPAPVHHPQDPPESEPEPGPDEGPAPDPQTPPTPAGP
jgi:putative nucleotidyltransferase with HDIG domain